MLGAIIGDIAGSRFERDNNKTKDFVFFTYQCSFTDDSVMSLAVAQAIMECQWDYHEAFIAGCIRMSQSLTIVMEMARLCG